MRKYFIFFILFSAAVFFNSRFSNAAKPSDFGLKEGDLISAIFSDDPDVYIINDQGYKRLFLNPEIFKFYAHLGGFANIKLVTPEIRDSFPTSGFFRNCEDNDQKVFGTSVEGEDNGRLHWINKSGDEAVREDPDFFKKVFCINRKEFNWYPRGNEFKALKEVPQYHRSAEAENPIVCHRPIDDQKTFQTIRVAPESLDAHFEHGDTKGACATYELPKLTPQPTITQAPAPSYSPVVYPLKLKLLSPNGGEKFSIGDKVKVTWEHPESINGVYFDLYKGGVYLAGLGGMGAGTQRRLEPYPTWVWDTTETSDFIPGSDFKLRMKDDSNPSVYDESDNYFSISGPNYSVACDSLKSNPIYTRYFNSCAEEGRYDYVCFNKNYGTYQGCVSREYSGCTVNNTNASQNVACPVSLNVSPIPTPTSTSTPNPTPSATPIQVQEVAYNVDLAIVDVIPSPSTPEAGKDFTVDVVIKNLGPKALSLPTITLTINNPSGQKIYDPATSYSDESNNHVISPGSTVNVKFYSDMFSPRLPETTLNFPAGIYTMIASVNNLGYVEGVLYKKDFNLNNDTLTKTLEIKSASTPTPTPTPTPTSVSAPTSVTIGWYKGFGGQPPVGTYQLAISFLYPSNISNVQSFRLYLKKPGESSFSAVATFVSPSSACSGDIYSGEWKMRNCISSGGEYWQILGPLMQSSSHPSGEYNAYLVALNNSGTEGVASAIPKNIVSKTTILSPIGVQNSLTPQFKWSVPSGWPGGSFWPQVNDSTNYVWSKAVYSGAGTTEGLTVYDGSVLSTSKTYYVNIWAEGNDSSGTKNFSMGESNPSFTVTTSSAVQSNFYQNLTLGSTGNDVQQLQALLVNEVDYSADLITGYFGRITRDAVKRLQEKYGVKPAYGYFGEITRRTLSALISH